MNSLPRIVTLAFASTSCFKEQEKASPSAPRPAARAGHALVYDTKREAVVMVNGDHAGPEAKKGELWQWDGTLWKAVDGKGPPPRTLSAVAYDTKRKELVLQGGIGPGDALNGDTWTCDGTKWRRHEDPKPAKNPKASTGPGATGPGVRNHHAMAFDAKRGVTVLFGGQDAAIRMLGDTWEWDGARWKEAATAGPLARVHHAMVWDGARERVLLFGGSDPGNDLGDLWEWDGKAWQKIEASGPSPRSGHRMAFHVEHQAVYLTGSRDFDATVWIFGSGEWRKGEGPTPPARCVHALAYDEARERLVLFGGSTQTANLDDTWELVDDAWVRVEPPASE